MAEYIEREAAIESFRKSLDGGYVLTNDAQTTHILQSLPAADVAPVVRGKWIIEAHRTYYDTRCSVCGIKSFVSIEPKDAISFCNFCPNCGADMRPEPPKEET